MNGRIVFRILLTLFLVAGIAALGSYVYNIGLIQGRAQGALLANTQGETAPYPQLGYWPYFRPFGFGFGLFGPFFLLLFIFFIARILFWRPYWGWGRHYGGPERDIDNRFEEWHRKQHENQPEEG